jgi:hypothetical protein
MNVLEECFASIFRVEEYAKQDTSMKPDSKHSVLSLPPL